MTKRRSLLVGAIALSLASPGFADPGAIAPMPLAETAQPPVDDRARAVECMATAIAYEAAHEPLAGREAVAEVILNRVRDPAFPNTVCGVVFAGSTRRTGCQFSFTCDGSLARRLPPAIMAAAREVASAALDGRNVSHAIGATSYHADYVSPYWAPSLIRVAQIGAHIFYRRPGAFDQLPQSVAFMPGQEPAVAALAVGASRSEGIASAPPPSAPKPFAPWGLSIALAGAGR